MKKLLISCGFIAICLFSCNMNDQNPSIEKLKAEVVQTEHDFAEMLKKDGMAAAFLQYAAEDAVLNRNNTIISGKNAIKAYFDKMPEIEQSLTWAPDFVDVSASGDLAYTYGKFTYSTVDTSGKTIESKGIFHSVWKKQEDGSWKYVWD